jgi:uncharacterized protein YkwD
MAAKASKPASATANIRRFDLSEELRSTAHRRKQTASSGGEKFSSQDGVPAIAQRLTDKFPRLGLDVVHAVLSEIFRANPNCSRQQLASYATAHLLEMSSVDNGPQSVTSFEPASSGDTSFPETSAITTNDSDMLDGACAPCDEKLSHESNDFTGLVSADFEDLFDGHLSALLALDEGALLICVKTCVSMLRRIAERPEDERVRRLRCSNARFQSEVGCHEPALEILRLAGFAEERDDSGENILVFRSDEKTSAIFKFIRESLEGILDALSEDAAVTRPNPETKSRPVDAPPDERRRIAELTEQRLRDPRGFREAACQRGKVNRASGQGGVIRTRAVAPMPTPSRKSQHFTLADVERMRIDEEIANTPSYAEEYVRAKHSEPVHDISALVLRSYDPELLARKALDLTNRYRASKGLPPCQWHPGIARIAAEHASQMASGRATFSHDGFDARVRAFPIVHRAAAENLAYNKGVSTVAETAVDGWIKSPGHEKNLRGTFNLCGIGVSQASDGSFYLTQLFALGV